VDQLHLWAQDPLLYQSECGPMNHTLDTESLLGLVPPGV
jgi:hypothetical protein